MIIAFRFLLTIFAGALIFFGVVMSISPLPFGFVFVILGFLILAAAAPGFLRWMRKRARWFDKIVHGVEKVLPHVLAKHLRDTDYDHGDEDEDDDDDSDDDGVEPKAKRRRT
jgi:hypothetical protein